MSDPAAPPPPVDGGAIEALEERLSSEALSRLDTVADRIAAARERGERVVAVTGSGPNLHEGVTTLIAELVRLGVIDGVTTSSAVVAHEMAGTLDRVKRVDGAAAGVGPALLPKGGTFELTLIDEELAAAIARRLPLDRDLIARLEAAPGDVIIKAAGNLGYPVGLWIETIAKEILEAARAAGESFEEAAGRGADPRTMIGAAARRGVPVLVTIPQLIGGGAVGLAIGDSIPIAERARRLAEMLEGAAVIIESAVALTQEIHDGPFETYTGHGLWAGWRGERTFSLEGKTLVRIDLDPALETVWRHERDGSAVQRAIDEGLPKTKLFDVPFRMEMSGFARLETSVPIGADIGVVWPLLAWRLAGRLGLDLDLISSPQDTPAGASLRQWIADSVRPLDLEKALEPPPAGGRGGGA